MAKNTSILRTRTRKPHLISASFVLPLLSALFLGAGAVAPGSTSANLHAIPRDDVAMRPGVVVDRSERRLFVMRPDGGVEALDAESGKVRWMSVDLGKPLALLGDRLLTQLDASEPGRLLLALADVRRQGTVVDRLRVDLPDDVVASIDDRPGRSFEAWVLDYEGAVYLTWRERRRPIAAVERLQEKASERRETVRLDFRAGTSEKLDPREDPGIFDPLPPDLLDGERLDQLGSPQFRSADGRHVLTSERVADNRTWDKYEWTLWNRGAQERIGQLRDFQRHNNFLVIAPIVIYEVARHVLREGGELKSVQLSIKAVDLRTGNDLWQRPIRNTAYVGPLPH